MLGYITLVYVCAVECYDVTMDAIMVVQNVRTPFMYVIPNYSGYMGYRLSPNSTGYYK